jgi:hypothetical protein
MVPFEGPEFSWAIVKASLIVISGFGSVLYLAWVGAKTIAPHRNP